jgi:hypothetical protein
MLAGASRMRAIVDIWETKGSKTWFLAASSGSSNRKVKRARNTYPWPSIKRRRRNMWTAWPILSPCTTAQMLVAFDEPCLII